MTEISNSLSFKPHYLILDGLRGVAALIVVIFHLLESHSTSHLDLMINHAYLAVDFFFLLSGFVIGYAYDDRWNAFTVGEFFKRRLIRLQPLVIMGTLIGAALFYFQDSTLFPNIHEVPLGTLLLVTLVGCTMLPLLPSMDIRGWSEMHPLNGPAWSLFFEYIGNFIYGIWVRKFSTQALAVLVFLSACLLVHMALSNPEGDVIGGWSITLTQLHIGFARLLYPFFGGLLLFRVCRLASIRQAFLWSSLLLVVSFAVPRIGGTESLWMNGLYDSLTILFVFPLIVYIGASGKSLSSFQERICKFLGDISYPIYITHFPLILIYSGWVSNGKKPLSETYPVLMLTFLCALLLAYASMKWYDEPVRKWLKRKFENR